MRVLCAFGRRKTDEEAQSQKGRAKTNTESSRCEFDESGRAAGVQNVGGGIRTPRKQKRELKTKLVDNVLISFAGNLEKNLSRNSSRKLWIKVKQISMFLIIR